MRLCGGARSKRALAFAPGKVSVLVPQPPEQQALRLLKAGELGQVLSMVKRTVERCGDDTPDWLPRVLGWAVVGAMDQVRVIAAAVLSR